jgi:alcohol dehydrogenase class IV
MAALGSYEFVAPAKIVFGWGRRREVGVLGRLLGRRAFLVSGLPEGVGRPIIGEIGDALRAQGIELVLATEILHEPEVQDVDRLSQRLSSEQAASGVFMLAIGGGAAMDLAKSAGAMAVNRQSETVADYLENVGRGFEIVDPPLPVLAMPATAGTGAEATKNAVISSYDPPFKKSLRDDRLMPRIALVDPELTVSVPAKVTAASGMDAITQLFESYISRKAKPLPRALAVQGLQLAIPAIVQAVEHPDSREAREAMAHAALLSGMALANSGLGMAHGVAPAMGIHCRTPHGLACALMLPVALRINSDGCAEELSFLGNLLFGRGKTMPRQEAIEVLIGEIEGICRRIGIPRRLSELGVRREQIPDLVKSSRGSSMSGNPQELTDRELTAILEGIF